MKHTKNRYFIVDFDSTFVQVEALDELAKISLAKNRDRDKTVARIQDITRQGMEGTLSIDKSLNERIKLLHANRQHLATLTLKLKKSVSPSVKRNKEFFRKNAANIFIVTSGFREYVVPVVKDFGIKETNVLANSFEFDKLGNISAVKKGELLAKPKGKVEAVRRLKLKGEVIALGDGYTDYEMREAKVVNRFFAFTENVERPNVMAKADGVVKSLDEFLYLNQLPTRFSYPRSRILALLLENVHPVGIEALKADGFSVETYNEALTETELIARLPEVSLLGLRSKTQLSAKALESAKKLMAVGAFCIGTDQVDLGACAKRGIAVFNAPYSNTRSVVELALGEIIMLMRRTFEASAKLHQGIWLKSSAGSYEIRGKKLGIVGYGNIGSQLSVLAEGLGMEVYYYDVVEKLALGNARKCKTLNELLAICDVITTHIDGRASNRNFIGAKQFQAMKDGAIFLNLSRGIVVNIEALVEALKSGKVAGAAVDVFPKEPKGKSEEFVSELRGFPNVILTPHVGGSTAEAQQNISDYVSRKLIEYVNDGSSFGSVNFPNIQLPKLQTAHRLLHIHKNVPGILAEINSTLAEHRINILGQYLKTTEEIGYVITDVNKKYDEKVIAKLKDIGHTIKCRVLY
jgi:D-3-phosphoglycerate dehydrogenase